MKIMYVINSFGTGGAERHLVALVGHMVWAGHSVMVVGLTGTVVGGARSIEDNLRSAGARIETINRAGVGWVHEMSCWLGLCKLAKAWAPDILHSHLPKADFVSSVVKRTLPGIIWISTVHDAYIKGVYSGYWVFRWLGWNWLLADHIIAVSGHAQRWVLDVLRLPATKTSVIYHGIAELPADIKVRSEVSDANQPFLIGCLARFEPRKGIATLIKAMVTVCAKHPRARLVIAGSDPTGYGNEMRRLVNELKVGHAVSIQKFCNEPLDFLRRLDVFAFASVSEGFGIVLLEAMAVGIPVVVSDIYPLNHIVSKGQTGMLANPAEPETFAVALIDLLENPELANRMGEAGRRKCLEEFSEEKMMRTTESLYLRLANRLCASNLPFDK